MTDENLVRIVEHAMCDGRFILARSAPEFLDLTGKLEPNGVLIDLSAARPEIEALVPAVVARRGRMPVLLYTPLDRGRAGDVLRIAQCFPTSVILVGSDDIARGIGRFLRGELGLTVATALVLELAEDMPAEVRWIVARCLARPGEPPSVTELASIAAEPERTFRRRIEGACGMSPHALVTRTRLLLAAATIHVTRLPIARVAEVIGYAEAASLWRSMNVQFGWRCGALRERRTFPPFVQTLRARYPRWFIP